MYIRVLLKLTMTTSCNYSNKKEVHGRGGWGTPIDFCIDCLQSIPRESNDKDMAAMLDELTIEANEESFVIVLQHGGNDVT